MHTYNMIDINIEFDGKTMSTPVYIKMDAPEQLLLSEGVYRQLTWYITYYMLYMVQTGGPNKNSVAIEC